MVSVEVNQRLSKVDMMRKCYEVLTISMVTAEGEEDKSQAYYIIKVAQPHQKQSWVLWQCVSTRLTFHVAYALLLTKT